MSPSKKDKRRAKATGGSRTSTSATTTAWALAFYKTAGGVVPARQFLVEVPQPVREMLLAIVVARA